MSEASPTRIFSAHAVAARWEGIPEAARAATVRTVLNSIGCALGGARHPAVDTVSALATSLSGAPVATAIGRAQRLDPARAALLNGLAGSVHAFDDNHAHSIVHPGTPVTVAGLAAAEASGRQATGADLLNAIAWGLEITCRISRAISPGMPMAVSQTGTVATVGAAVSAGLLFGLGAGRLADAIGIAAASASGIRAGHGTTTMHLLPARAASVGVEAALLAAAGCDSADEALIGKHGFFAAFGGSASADGLLDGLGARFELEAITFKPYPCGVVIAPVIDACLALRGTLGDEAEGIAEIVIQVAPSASALADREQPATELEAQVSLQHWAAAALLTGRAGLEEGALPFVIDHAELAGMRRRCRIAVRETMSVEQAEVSVRMGSGRVGTVRIDRPLGSLGNPMNDDQLDVKFSAQASRTLGREGAVRALSACRTLEGAGDVGEFARFLTG